MTELKNKTCVEVDAENDNRRLDRWFKANLEVFHNLELNFSVEKAK